MKHSESLKILNSIQEDYDAEVKDMYDVFIHWLDETIDHLKKDNLVWEHVHSVGPPPTKRR